MPSETYTIDAHHVLTTISEYESVYGGGWLTADQACRRLYLGPDQVRDALSLLLTRGLIDRHPESDPPVYRLADHGNENPDYLSTGA